MDTPSIIHGVHLARELVILQRELAVRRAGSEFLADVFNELAGKLAGLISRLESDVPVDIDPDLREFDEQ